MLVLWKRFHRAFAALYFSASKKLFKKFIAMLNKFLSFEFLLLIVLYRSVSTSSLSSLATPYQYLWIVNHNNVLRNNLLRTVFIICIYYMPVLMWLYWLHFLLTDRVHACPNCAALNQGHEISSHPVFINTIELFQKAIPAKYSWPIENKNLFITSKQLSWKKVFFTHLVSPFSVQHLFT